MFIAGCVRGLARADAFGAVLGVGGAVWMLLPKAECEKGEAGPRGATGGADVLIASAMGSWRTLPRGVSTPGRLAWSARTDCNGSLFSREQVSLESRAAEGICRMLAHCT